MLTKTPPQPTTETKTNHSRKRKKPNVPQPGEPGYKTPTQLRNERKRRAKKQHVGVKVKDGKSTTDGVGTSTNATSNSKSTVPLDPSSRYLSNPTSAPLVQKAVAFFKTTTPKQPGGFKIHPVGGSDGATLTGWRTVAKLAVRAKDGKISIGLFAPNSHDLLPVPNCAAHHPSINSTVSILERLLNRSNNHKLKPNSSTDNSETDGTRIAGATTAFDETTGKGHLRHVAINVERSTGKVQITLVWNSHPFRTDENENDNTEEKKILDSLTNSIVMAAAAAPSADGRKRRRGRKGIEGGASATVQSESVQEKQPLHLHSLWIHFNASWKHSNAIFSIEGGPDCWKHVYGPICIEEVLSLSGQALPVALRFPPNVFRQANLDAFTNIIGVIRATIKSKFVDSKPSCVELYGGVGTIGLNVADLTSALISSDENPFNKECFLAAAAGFSSHDISMVTYESKNATAMVRSNALEKGQVIIVDPPRKGLDDDVLAALCSAETPELLVYVSCGFDAFQRDCSALLKSRWRLDHAEGHLLFPGSDAIETLAFFTRK